MRDVAGQITAESELPSVCTGASNKLAVGSLLHILAAGFYTFGIAACTTMYLKMYALAHTSFHEVKLKHQLEEEENNIL